MSEYRCDGQTIEEPNATVYGHGNTVTGAGSTVTGNNNTVTGDGATVTGDDNMVSGDDVVVHGARNTVTGAARVVLGESNFVVTNEDSAPPAVEQGGVQQEPRRPGPRGAVAARRWSGAHIRGGQGGPWPPTATNGPWPPTAINGPAATRMPWGVFSADGGCGSGSGARLSSGPAEFRFGVFSADGGHERGSGARLSSGPAPPPAPSLREILEAMADRDRALDDGAEDRVQCVICNERVKCVALDPCGHVETCAHCTLKLVKIAGGAEIDCPVCKGVVRKVAFARV